MYTVWNNSLIYYKSLHEVREFLRSFSDELEVAECKQRHYSDSQEEVLSGNVSCGSLDNHLCPSSGQNRVLCM